MKLGWAILEQTMSGFLLLVPIAREDVLIVPGNPAQLACSYREMKTETHFCHGTKDRVVIKQQFFVHVGNLHRSFQSISSLEPLVLSVVVNLVVKRFTLHYSSRRERDSLLSDSAFRAGTSKRRFPRISLTL